MKDSWKETTAGMRQQQQDEEAELDRQYGADPTTGQINGKPINQDTSEVDLFQYFNKQPSKEELAREQRRLQREEQWAGIKDALNALSEMNTSQNHQYVPRTTLSDKARARREAITAQRQKERNNYYQGYMQARAADAQRLLQRRQEERQKVLEQQADEKYQAELAKTQAEAEYNKAKAEAARRVKTTTSKSLKPYTTMVMDGKEVSFQDQSEYERYVRDKAREYGISDTVSDGNVFNPHTRKKSINEIAAEVQAENRNRTSKSSPSAQSSNNGDGNNADANGEAYDEF
jgi:hypothetical protein